MVTIKALSEELSVSKVGLTKWIERHGYKDRLQKQGNKYLIPADVEQVIRANFDRREQKHTETVNTIPAEEKTVTEEIIALLRDQLEAKDREIDRLHTQVENLQMINADMTKAIRELNTLQAMQITDGTGREQVERTENEARENDTLSSEEVETIPEKDQRKKSFWGIFRTIIKK